MAGKGVRYNEIALFPALLPRGNQQREREKIKREMAQNKRTEERIEKEKGGKKVREYGRETVGNQRL